MGHLSAIDDAAQEQRTQRAQWARRMGGTAVGRGVNRGHNFCRLRSLSTAFSPPDYVCLPTHTRTQVPLPLLPVRLPPPTNPQRDPQHIYNICIQNLSETPKCDAQFHSNRIERRKIETPEFSIPFPIKLCIIAT